MIMTNKCLRHLKSCSPYHIIAFFITFSVFFCLTLIHVLTPSKIVQFMEDLAVFTALNHSESFGKNFVKED